MCVYPIVCCVERHFEKMWSFSFKLAFLVVSMIIGSISAKVNQSDLIVSVKQGKLKGSVQELFDGTPYYSFKGMPYALPPVGDLRFRAPSEPVPWTGIRDATEHGSICSQFDLNTNLISGSENCLFINVYTRSLTNARSPVMVFIYGGGFSYGSGNQPSYGPEFLLQHDVIVVTFNYRLEVLGFLSLDTPEVPGNAGMKDQVMALRWIKENIAQFGGDPDNVTIFGESAGAVAVTYHLLSPMSKGLFHKAIAQSGICIDDSGIATDAKERAFRVAKVLGKETTNTQELLEFLRRIPAARLANMTFVTETADEKLRGVPMRFGPVIEKDFPEAFIFKNPLDILPSKDVNRVPVIVGYNSAEGLLLLADQLKKSERLNANNSFLVPRELLQKVTKTKLKELGKRIMKFYTGNKGMGNGTAQGIVKMRTDMHFAYNTHRFAHLYKEPVYLYRFDYSTELNVVKNLIGLSHFPGASHADDLFYLFDNEQNRKLVLKERLRRIIFELTKLWTDFAKTGDPTPEGSPKWPRHTPSGREYFALNEVTSSARCADADRMEMWNTMYCEVGLPCIV